MLPIFWELCEEFKRKLFRRDPGAKFSIHKNNKKTN